MLNPWTTFESLLPTKNRWVGQIQSISGGKAVVSLPVGLGGGAASDDVVVDAPGSYSINDFVFIEGGVIISEAPALRAAFSETVY